MAKLTLQSLNKRLTNIEKQLSNGAANIAVSDNEMIINGFIFEKMDEKGEIFFSRDVVFNSVFDDENVDKYEGSTIAERLKQWAKSNLPADILAKYDVRLPHESELFGETAWPAIEADRRKRIKFLHNSDDAERDYACWYWTDTYYGKYGNTAIFVYVSYGGSVYYFNAYYERGVVPVLVKKIKLGDKSVRG